MRSIITYSVSIMVAAACGAGLIWLAQTGVQLALDWSSHNLVLSYREEVRPREQLATPPVEPPTITLAFVGDIMLDRGVRSKVEKLAGGNYDWLFEQIKVDLVKPDVMFGNLEGPLSDRGRDLGNLYSFRMEPRTLAPLTRAGFDVLTVANNHAGDWGREAFLDTLANLRQAGILSPGGGINYLEATTVKVKEVSSEKIGFLAFTDVGPEWLVATDVAGGVALSTDPNFATLIGSAARAVDTLIVSLHFGTEYAPAPSVRQQALARQAIEAGAKIVVGHHPHVVQPLEKYGGGLIIYSLGNFIFDQTFSAATMSGRWLEVELQAGEIVTATEKTVKLDHNFRPALSDQ